MKKLLTFLLLFFIFHSKAQNEVEKIQSLKDLKTFINQFNHIVSQMHLDSNLINLYTSFEDNNAVEIKNQVLFFRIIDSLNIKPYYKFDFNQDGRLDLLINGFDNRNLHSGYYGEYHAFLFYSNKGSYDIVDLNTQRKNFNVAFPTYTDLKSKTITVIKDYGYCAIEGLDTWFYTEPKTSELYFFEGEILESKKDTSFYYIHKIELDFNIPGFDTFRHLRLDLYPEYLISNMEAINYDYNNSQIIDGEFEVNLKNQWHRICQIINLLDLNALHEHYDIGATDKYICNLKIFYNDVKEKSIEDVGMEGSFGLKKLYHVLLNLPYNQKWKKK